MKIIYLHQYFTFPDASGGTRSYDLSSQFLKAGHQVTVVTTNAQLKLKTDKKWTVIHREGLELHVLDLPYSNRVSFAKRMLIFIRFLVAASFRLLKIKADVVLATSTPLSIAVPAIVKRMVHRTPYLFEVRDVWPEVPIAMGIIKNKMAIGVLNRMESYVYRKSKHVVALSDDMKQSIVTRTAMPEKSVTVIPNISEITRFSAYDPQKSYLGDCLGFRPEKVVLYAGTLGKVNGLKYMVELAAHTYPLDPSITYIVFGDGMEKDELVGYAAELGILDKNFFFCKPVPKAMLPQIYHEATVACSYVIPLPALWANSANKFFDSLAAGKPIIINHLGWQADVIRDQNVGYVLHHSPASMAEEAKRFANYLNDDQLLQKQGINAAAVARSRYSLEVAAGKYHHILSHVV